MRVTLYHQYWIDRFFGNDDPVAYFRKRIMVMIRSEWIKLSSKLFAGRVWEFSLFIKNHTRVLEFIAMEPLTYRTMKALSMMIGAVLGIITYAFITTSLLSPLLLVIPVLALIGFFVPEMYVADREQQIKYEIHTDFPRFLDLLHLYTSSAAFEHLGSAMYEVANSMEGTLAKQLRKSMSVYRFVDLHTFLDRFEETFSTPLARDLVATLRLAEEYGGSLSDKIGTLADEAHKERMQNAKKAGQKASAALLVPLMLFHFPVAIIIFIAPTVLALKEVFGW